MAKREVKVHRVNCLLTMSQYKAIKAAADAAGLGLSAYMRQASLYRATMDGGKE